MMRGAPRIAFVGPIAEVGKPAVGGFEAANRRTIDLLRAYGIDVIELAYPIARGSVIAKSATYALRYAAIMGELLRRRRDWDLLHITPHLHQFLTAERFLCMIPRMLKRPLLLDLRAGTLISTYDQSGPLYRFQLARLIKSAGLVAFEGMEYEAFVRRWHGGPIFHFPNYVRWSPAYDNAVRLAPGETREIRLITVGRIVPEKGVETSIAILKALLDRGISASLDIVGGGDPAYIDRLRAQCRSAPVVFAGPLPPNQVMMRLSSRHFFIFATTHWGEGHSNALTEAMACGVVPIASDNGFNKDVIGAAGVVLPAAAPLQDYVGWISKLAGHDALWRALSRAANARVRNHFSDLRIIPNLIEHYTELVPSRDPALKESVQ